MENKTYEIRGNKYSSEKHYYDFDKERRYPTFKVVDTKIFTCETTDLDNAYLWMLNNHPEYAIGCGIKCLDNSDFLMDAVPDYYVLEFGLTTKEIDFSEIVSLLIKDTENRISIRVA